MNYHIGRLVLCSLCAGAFGADGFWWCSFCRLQPAKRLDGAVRRHHPNGTHDLRSGSQDHHTSTKWLQKTICCNLTSSAPDHGHMRPKQVELKKHKKLLFLHQVGISLYYICSSLTPFVY